MFMTYYIYKITNLMNNKVYIGYSKDVPQRMRQHKILSSKDKPKHHLHRAIKKYGWENFLSEIIFCSKDKEYTLKEMEPYFILEYKTLTESYNMTRGGDGVTGHKHSDETKKRLSDLCKGKSPWNKGRTGVFSEEYLEGLKQRKTGNSYHLGHKCTDEAKQKMREKKIGYIPWNKGKKLGPNPAHSERLKGSIPWNKGVKTGKHSLDHIRKNKESNSEWWRLISPSGECFTIKNKKQFCSDHKEYNLSSSSLSLVSLGNRKHHKGWTCEKLEKL